MMKSALKKQSSVLFVLLAMLLILALLPLQVFAQTDSENPDITVDSTDSTEGSSDNSTDTTTDPVVIDRIHGGYAFSDRTDLTVDEGGKYPLSTKTFGAASLQSVNGYRGGGMFGYVTVDNTFFTDADAFSVGFWTKFSLESAKAKSTIFRVNGKNGESVDLAFSTQGRSVLLVLTVKDASRTATCSYDVTNVLKAEESWIHFAFTYKKFGSASMVQLYVNGETAATSSSTAYVDLSALAPSVAAFQGVTVDELYITDIALDRTKITSMMTKPLGTFYALEQLEIEGGSSSGSGGSEEGPVEVYPYMWAAYLFEGTYNAGADFNQGAINAAVDNSCARIDTEPYGGAFGFGGTYGFGMVRREGTAPAYYLNLDSRLLRGQTAFSFSCWVYRDGTVAPNEECLLDLSGKGVLRFAPYAVSMDGKDVAYLEYTDSRGKIQHSSLGNGTLPSPMGEWVHYALTVSQEGLITVYMNGAAIAAFETGLSPADLDYSVCRLVTGTSSSDPTRTVLDEVYFCPEVLDAAEMRKIRYYGLSKYTTGILPDPGVDGGDKPGTGNSGDLAPSDIDIAEDSFSKVGSIINGFIGTTFDERVALGRDWNNGAEATATGGKLTTGVSSYGLSLDGSSFLRYPMGILDGANALTISLSYSWNGTTSATSRSQRLFDFSRKASSVSAPTAYIYLETGLGFGGLKFGMSDGVNSTYLTYDYNEIDVWTRVTVTVENGVATLYVNDQAVDSANTGVNIASICPNFCYIGRSGVKGDPMFKGAVDEIYISDSALPAEKVGIWCDGIAAAVNYTENEQADFWDSVIRIIIIVAVALVLAVIVILVVVLVKREKKPEIETPKPSPIRPEYFAPEEPTVLGPRSARRARMEAEVEDPDATVKFRRVRDESAEDPVGPDATTKFRKVDVDGE